ncbi:MAG: 50S ribosomal protein L22 [Candidatus Pacebacteria bacterium]|nr:50S ribosomal protein L22 [Candidatus Paceibacterota bacterium]
MKIRAEQRNSRQSPRKVRLVANQIKDLPLEQALRQLALIERKATIVILKVMRQAIANAVNNHGLTIDQLELDQILVKTGPTYKRFRAVSRGRAHKILKRTCHVEVILKTKQKETKEQATKSKPAPAKEKKTEDKKAAKPASSAKKTKKKTTKKQK